MELFEFLKQQLLIMLSVPILTVALGVVYIFVTPPTYTARATMIIDRGKMQARLGGTLPEIPVDLPELESQIQLIKSESVALAVIKKLNLVKVQEFVSAQPRLGGWLRKFPLLHVPKTEKDPIHSALATLSRNLTVNRIGGYVVQIEFRSLSPELAAEVANAFAESYIQDQLSSKYLAAHQTASWLQGRTQELAEQSSNADKKTADFRARNNMVAAGGRLISDEQLGQLNSQLILSREKTAEARARLERIEAIVGDAPDRPISGTVSDTINNPIIVKLRTQYLSLVSREADWSRRFGEDHRAVVDLRRQIRDIRSSIAAELHRIAEAYKSDLEIAKRRQAELEKVVAEAMLRSNETSQAQIQLRQLESTGETYRSLYNVVRERALELTQRGTFPDTAGRLITRALASDEKASPNPVVVLLASAFGGMMLGVAGAMLRVALDRVFRTPSQVEASLQTNCIAVVPLLKPNVSTTKRKIQGACQARTIRRDNNIIWHVVDRPLSRFAEAMRSIKSFADFNGPERSIKVLGITSSLPGEGKSAISATLALVAAQTGARTILVDCDLRHPVLSGLLASNPEHGITDVLSGDKTLADVVWRDPVTGLMFLPTTSRSPPEHSSRILASPQLRALFDSLRLQYDYVIVDFSPIAPIVDVRSARHLVDSYVLIVEWARTKIDVAQQAFAIIQSFDHKPLGVVLNKVDFHTFRRQQGHLKDYYSDKHYAQYGEPA